MTVVKTRLQMMPGPGQPPSPYRSVGQTYALILRTEGARALFRGALPRVMIVAPLFAITVLVYEFQQRFFASSKGRAA
jgi:hypothetical protein